jgi:hypothetical protein
MEEYETLIADTAENCAELFKWKQAGRVEIYDAPRWLLSAHFGLHFGQKYRRRKPAQPKVKKLVDRTDEELIPMLGLYLVKSKENGHVQVLFTNVLLRPQSEMIICKIGETEWQPMQKEIEVEG